MKVQKKQMAILLTTIIFVLWLIPSIPAEKSNSAVTFTFAINGIITVILLTASCKRSTFSCRTFHYVFCLFFFFIAPYIQYAKGKWPLVYTPTNEGIIKENILICVWEILFFSATLLRKRDIYRENIYVKKGKVPSKTVIYLLIILSGILVAWMVSRVGVITLISSRDGGENVFAGFDSSVSSLLTYVVRNTITFTALFALFRFKWKRDNIVQLTLAFVLLAIGCSPIGMPRFEAATVYIAVIVLAFPKLAKRRIFLYGFIFAFIVMFPLLDVFRYNLFGTVSVGASLQKIGENVVDYYLTGNFDAFVMTQKTFDYCSANGFTLGHQLLGSALFWVPRSLWLSKPLSTAALVQNSFGYYGVEANVSSCFIAEAYVDFGIVGVIIYSIVLGTITHYIDNRINLMVMKNEFDLEDILWVLMPTLFFFMMRGALMSTFGFAASFCVVGVMLIKFARKFK